MQTTIGNVNECKGQRCNILCWTLYIVWLTYFIYRLIKNSVCTWIVIIRRTETFWSPCTWPFWSCFCFLHQTRLLHDLKLPQFCKWDLCSSVALIGSYWLPRSVIFWVIWVSRYPRTQWDCVYNYACLWWWKKSQLAEWYAYQVGLYCRKWTVSIVKFL